MDKLNDITEKLHDLQGRLVALECFTSVLRDVKAGEGTKLLGEALLYRTEEARVSLLNRPVADRVLQVFDTEVERLLARLDQEVG
ncbi:hypothetical protein [Caldimonas tepidiphila]|uniref:hypothetical protein n=1 Tax=Caldimonas tepidiphila TaxID=2315841 RepID=UPI000E5B6CF9|nr:hypothetical protein [Caldimonas tepidiphila]